MSITMNLVFGHHMLVLQDAPGHNGVDEGRLERILWYSNNEITCFKSAAKFSHRTINEKPFHSFNKRIAMAVIGDYLFEAGFELTASSLEVLQFVNNIENGLSLDEIEAYILENSKPL